MYTLEMATAFKSIVPPENFGVEILDAGDFLTVRINPDDLNNLDDKQKLDAVQYVKNVKVALENAGGIVWIVREASK
jgi:hypothetical protein